MFCIDYSVDLSEVVPDHQDAKGPRIEPARTAMNMVTIRKQVLLIGVPLIKKKLNTRNRLLQQIPGAGQSGEIDPK
jgi:hypothetical protein